MKITLLLLSIFVYDVASANVANLLADRALKTLSEWINSEGTAWLTLPGYYKKGQVQSDTEFTLAFAGPELEKIETISRSGDAQLDDDDPDPSYDTSQTLQFTASFKNITVDYAHVTYRCENSGFLNLTSKATTNGVSVRIFMNLKGQGDSCTASVNFMDVSFNGSLSVNVAKAKTDQEIATVARAVETHFKNNVPKAVGTLLKTATFGSLEYYDVCTGVYYPHSPPNVLAGSVLNVASRAMVDKISDWAILPAFTKNAIVNDTNLDIITVGQGNFSSFGHLKRIGKARYENLVDPKLMNLSFSYEVTNLTASYDNIEYVDYLAWFKIAQQVTVPKIQTNLNIAFTRSTPSSLPSCVQGGVTVESKYLQSAGGLLFTNLTPTVPRYATKSVNEVLEPEFLADVEQAANDLFRNAIKYALTEVCK